MAKSEQAGFIDKHLEKLVLALAVVGMLVVLSKWAFHTPYHIQSGSGTAIAPDEIPADLLHLAEVARSEIEKRTVKLPPMPEYTRIVTTAMQDAVPEPMRPCVQLTPPTELPKIDPRFKPNTEAIAAMGPLPPLQAVQVSLSQETIRRAAANAFGAADQAEDVFGAHVTAVLDYPALVRPWLPLYKERGVDIMVLFLELTAQRQELLSDGTWGQPEQIAGEHPAMARGFGGPAEQISLNPDARLVADSLSRQAYIDRLRQMYGGGGVQQDVLEPDYFPIFWSEVQNWGTWKHHLPRTDVNAAPDIELDPNDMPPQAGSLLTQVNAPVGRPLGLGAGGPEGGGERSMITPSRPPGRPMGGMPGGGGEGRAMMGRGGPQPIVPTTQDRNQQMAQTSLDKATKALNSGDYDEAIKEANNALRLVPGMNEAVNVLRDAQEYKRQATLPPVTKVPSLMAQCKSGKVQVWLHDASCQVGKTYRYRLTLKLFNPLFGQGDSLPLANPADAGPLTLSTTSDWSGPVTATPEIHFFLAGSSKENQDVHFEVYRQRLGQWLVQRAGVKCGDGFGNAENRKIFDQSQQNQLVEKDVDFNTGYTMVDCDFDHPATSGGLAETTTLVTLMGPDGRLVVRDLASDKKSALHRDLLEKAKQAEEWLKNAATSGPGHVLPPVYRPSPGGRPGPMGPGGNVHG